MDLSKIDFGRASAETEGHDAPNLLINGYLDAEGIKDKAISGNQFLFLGYKGSGKSALGEHINLIGAQDPLLFVNRVFLAEFPFKTFKSIVGGSSEGEAKYPLAWSWLLLVNLIDSLSKDQGATTELSYEFNLTLKSLRTAGILPAKELKDVVLISSKTQFKVNLVSMFEVAFEGNTPTSNDLQISYLVDYLKRLVASFNTTSRHMLIIDGLDDILTTRDVQYQSLAALVSESARINQFLYRNSIPAKVLLLCRTDLFERLPGPNKNKMRQDNAVEFDWYHDPREPKSSKLITLANLRAGLVYPEIKSVFEQFFPQRVNIAEDEIAIYQYLLNNTRHTPRDFLQLLRQLQHFSTGSKLTVDQIDSGIRKYSFDYFLPEIKDELVGYVSPENSEKAFRLIASIRKTDFSMDDIWKEADKKKELEGVNFHEVFHALYECSAIGNIEQRNDRPFYFFKYRNRHSSFNPDRRIALHRGLWKAISVG